ncbi:MAG: NUDIX hydrolase [Pseudobacteriovorax sp.]|nr:NUDIX hydrolase [Pseudobacteriovorax sp.]
MRAHIFDIEDHLLIIKCDGHIGLDWEVPGGGIQDNETPTEALKRELYEEVGLKKYQIVGHAAGKFYEMFTDEIIKKGKLNFDGQVVEDFVIKLQHRCPDIICQDQEVSEFRWITANEAHKYLYYDNQLEVFRYFYQFYSAKNRDDN